MRLLHMMLYGLAARLRKVSTQVKSGGLSSMLITVTFWDALEDNPEHMACFAAAMTGYGQSTVGACLADFDWAGLGDATVVDVGGGRGSLSLPIAKQQPNLKVIVQDRPETCVEAEKFARLTMVSRDC